MIRHAEEHNLLGEEMQGSRKNRGTMDALFKRVITFDITRKQRSNGIVTPLYGSMYKNLTMMCFAWCAWSDVCVMSANVPAD